MVVEQLNDVKNADPRDAEQVRPRLAFIFVPATNDMPLPGRFGRCFVAHDMASALGVYGIYAVDEKGYDSYYRDDHADNHEQ